MGYTYSQRINTLTCDVIAASEGKGEIGQTPEIGSAMEELRQFMFEHVYRDPRAKGEEGKAQDVLLRLFEFYDKHPDDLPDEFQYIREKDGTTRAVADYIAGMTDSYAMSKYGELFLPAAWTVK